MKKTPNCNINVTDTMSEEPTSTAALKLKTWHLNIVFMLVLSVNMTKASGTNQSCLEAQLHCHALNGCRQAFRNFYTQCNSVIMGSETVTCPTACRNALISLFSAEDNAGVAFVNCDCQHGQMCSERKRRVDICKNEVMNSVHLLDNDTPHPVSCNLAKWMCEAETLCLTALRYYYIRCARLFSGEHRCTSKCKNSLRILSRQPRADKLRTCVCDGSEDFDCNMWKMSTEKLCFNKSRLNLPDKIRRRRRRRRRNRFDWWRKMGRRRYGRRGRRKRGRHRRKRNKYKELT